MASNKKKLSLATKVLIGLSIGLFCGLFFGEKLAFLNFAGTAFIQLMQMTVLPYIVVSLIGALGSLTYKDALNLAVKAGTVLLLLWAIGIAMVLIMPIGYPDWTRATFFSTSIVQPQPDLNLLELYIPANIFNSLSTNTIPAVVMFCIALGIALMSIGNKDTILTNFSLLADALSKITKFIIQLAPYGVFAIMASAAGTLTVDEFENLQVYIIIHMVAALLLSFFVLPWLVTSLTNYKYKEIVGPTRDALVTAFATGNLLIVLPILAERSKELLDRESADREESDKAVDIIIPISFSFPNLGKLLVLNFVLFAGWLINAEISPASYPVFAFTGLLTFFGSPVIAIPFLMDAYRIATDTFQLFLIADNLIGNRIGSLLAAMHTLVLAVLGSSAMQNRLIFKWQKLLIFTISSVVVTLVSLYSVRLFFEHIVEHKYVQYRNFVERNLQDKYNPALSHSDIPEPLNHDPMRSRLNEILKRGYLRVGYRPNALPYAFVNNNGKEVGYDIEMAHILAKDMKVNLELVRIEGDKIIAALNSNIVDIVMSGLGITMDRAEHVFYSDPYQQETFAFIVKDYRKDEFNSSDKVRAMENLSVAIPNSAYYIAKASEYLPLSKIVPINTPRDYFSGIADSVDALIFTAESGSAWCLIYPQYTVAVPQPDIFSIPLAYAVAHGDREWVNYINTWLKLKQNDGTLKSLFEYWIKGESSVHKEPRWSIIRDVLKWSD